MMYRATTRKKNTDKTNNKQALYAALNSTLQLDMYAIVDWHIYNQGNPLYRVDCAIEFFDEISSRYANEPGVIYEICNEPNGRTTWDDVYAYAEQVIPVIRKNVPGAIIIVGTPSFSTDIDAAIQKPLPYDNIMYTYHYYSGHSLDGYLTTLKKTMQKNFPIFITEWGIGKDTTSTSLELEHAENFLAYVNQHGISWANWSLCNKDEPFSAIRPDVNTLGGWTLDDLTVSGKMVFEALGN